MKLKLAAAGTLAAALFLAGCSSSSDSASTPTTPAASPSPTMSEPSAMPSAEAGTIVDVAAGNPDFSTLVAAVKAAGLAETLSGTGPFTVFAPTNAAFEALPAGVLDALLKPENKETLAKILTYHVVAGTVMAADVKPGDVASVEGDTIKVTAENGGVQVDGANVTATDVAASNGVIHVIDAVIVPAGVDVCSLAS